MSESKISQTEFQQVIPHELKPYVHVSISAIPESARSIVEAFGISLNSLNGRIRIRKDIHVMITPAPFTVNLSNGKLVYEPTTPGVINVHIENMIIFLDWQKMMQLDLPLQVACILEEFAHACMNISDEALVSDVVALLYDGVEIRNGQYFVRT